MAMAMISSMPTPDRAPVRVMENICQMPRGRTATIPAKMISEMPLPTPRLVICSPSHIRNSVPPVRVTTVETMKKSPGFWTSPWLAERPMAMPADWNTASTTVR